MPKFNSISISGYHMQEAGATADLELAYTLADGLEYLKTGVAAGIDIDAFAPRLSFFWAIGKNFFMEVAKMRAARVLWAKMVKQFNPKHTKTMALRTHCQTSGWSLTEQDPFNNVARTAIEGIAAARSATPSRCTPTPSTRPSRCRPTSRPASRATPSSSCRPSPGFAASSIPGAAATTSSASPTNSCRRPGRSSRKSRRLGGMAKAIEAGIPKMRIEEAAVTKQARIDSGKETIVGLNKYRLEKEDPLDILEVDNTAVRDAQIKPPPEAPRRPRRSRGPGRP